MSMEAYAMSYEDLALDSLVFPSSNDHYSFGIEVFDEFSNEEFLDMTELNRSWNVEVDACFPLLQDSSSSSSIHEEMSFSTTDMSSNEEVFTPSRLFFSSSSSNTSTEQDLGMFHLLKAYGEAKENQAVALAEVIHRRISAKVSAAGTAMERLGHHLLQGLAAEPDYLSQEASKNYAAALRAFYEICPYGRFAHFVANSSILESLPTAMQTIHIIDFDVGDGMQWPPLIATLGPQRSIRLTCIDYKNSRIEKTKNNLCGFARSMGLNLKVDEMSMEELLMEKTKTKSSKEWLVFNCMVGLPHMGSPKGRRQAWQFTRSAEELIKRIKNVCSGSNVGIITYGEGCGASSRVFSEAHLVKSHALFKSMEWHFPSQLSHARTAMECLFVGPSVSAFQCEACESISGQGLGGCGLGNKSLMEAKELVRGGGGGAWYEVKVEGKWGNEMVLEWRGVPIVRVSAWR